MQRTIQNLLLLFIFTTLCKCNLQPLQPEQATTHFYNNVKQIVEEQLNYQINKEVKNSNESFSLVVYNDKTYASTIGMRFEQAFNAYAKKKGIFTIKGVHSQEVTKYIFQYYEEELDMQMQLIPELIIRQGELELDGNNNLVKNPFFLHLIQDVRMSIIENNKNHRIEFDIESEDDQTLGKTIVMVLKSRESKLFKLVVSISSEKINNSQGLDKTEFTMNVRVQDLIDEENREINVSIPMISRNVNEFNKKMLEVHRFLDLSSYSNNNREHYLNLVEQMSQMFKGFTSKTSTDLEKQWEIIKFEMRYQKKVANGELVYNSEDGSYELTTVQDSKIKQKFTFKRMKNLDLKLLYMKQKVHSLFQTINEIVLELFQDKHQEIMLPALPNWVLQDYVSKKGMFMSMVARDYYGYKHNNDFLFTVDNHTDAKKVEITYYGYNMSNLKFTHIYPAERFELETAALYIEYVIKAHLDLMSQNGLLHNSYMI